MFVLSLKSGDYINFPLPEVAGFWHPQLSRWASAKNLVVQSHVNKSGNKSLYVEI